MIRVFMLTLCAHITFPSSAQVIENRVKTFIKQQRIDTFMVYSLPCAGGIAFDSCDIEESSYLFWKRGTDYHETIKPPTCYVFKHVKNKIDTLLETSGVDHSCYPTFLFNIGKRSLTKSADMYDLDFVSFADGRKNIYHDYNNKTKLKSIIDRTKAYLKELETDGKYVLE